MNPLNTLYRDLALKEQSHQSDLSRWEKQILSLFSDATPLDWESSRWQLQNRIKTKEALARIIDLTPEEEKGIEKEAILEVIEVALAAAYKKDGDRKGENVQAKLDPKTGAVEFWQVLDIVDESMIYSEEELEELKESEEEIPEDQTEPSEEEIPEEQEPDEEYLTPQEELTPEETNEQKISDLDKIYRLKKIYSRLIAISKILDHHSDDKYEDLSKEYYKLKDAPTQKITDAYLYINTDDEEDKIQLDEYNEVIINIFNKIMKELHN